MSEENIKAVKMSWKHFAARLRFFSRTFENCSFGSHPLATRNSRHFYSMSRDNEILLEICSDCFDKLESSEKEKVG